ncbi:unnamed protein product, partial [Brassica rapa subsp. trilocularis]
IDRFQIAGLLNRTKSLSLVHLFLNLRHLDTLTDNLTIFRLSDCLHILTVCGFSRFCNLFTRRTPSGMRIRRFVVSEMQLQYIYLYVEAEEFESALFSALDFTPIAIEIISYHFLVYVTPQMIFCPTKEEHEIDFFRCRDNAVDSFLNIELGVNAIVRFVELLGSHVFV